MWNLQMDALVFGENELSCFIPKKVIRRNRNDGGSVMILKKKTRLL
jgi:hypothetical protein